MRHGHGYTIERLHGCSVIRSGPAGGLPMNALAEVSRLHGRNAVMDLDLARMLDAAMVVGTRTELDDLLADPGTLARGREKEARLPASMLPEARRWLVWGEQGTSSVAAFEALSGYGVPGRREGFPVPSDLGDLRRCLLMVEAVPGFRERVHELAALSPEWERLAGAWDALEASLEAEAPGWRGKGGWRAPATGRLFSETMAGGTPTLRS